MRKYFLVLGLSLALASLLAPPVGAAVTVGRVPDRVVLTLDEGVDPAVAKAAGGIETGWPALQALLDRYGARDLARLYPEADLLVARADKASAAAEPLRRVWAVDFRDPVDLDAAVRDFGALPGVAGAEWVDICPQYDLPDDPYIQSGDQYYLRNTNLGGASIRAVGGWAESHGDTNVIVAIVDSGVDWQHPDLGGTGPDYVDGAVWINWTEYFGTAGVDDDANGKVDDWHGWDFVNGVTGQPGEDVDTPDNDPMDYESHGTACAGCAAAITDNGIGIAGAGWNCKVMAVRVGWLPEGATGGVVRMDFASAGILYAAGNGAKVINCSWGSTDYLAMAVDYAVSAGCIIVTAAGNDNDETASYLGSRTDVLAVAATDASDQKTSFSSYGTWVELSAPGVNITSTWWNQNLGTHTYASVNGTSFSSPITAGAAALVWSAHPAWSRTLVMNQLRSSADDIDAENPVYAGKLGDGRVNLLRALGDDVQRIPEEYPTLKDAMTEASAGDTIAILASQALSGTQTIIAKPLEIRGGYADGYGSRDPLGSPTPITASGSQPVLQFQSGATAATVVDGFHCSGGLGTFFSDSPYSGRYGGGVIVNQASPTIRNLVVTGNSVGSGSELGCGGGIFLKNSSATLENVDVFGNSGIYGAGVFAYQGAPTLVGCRIHDNTCLTSNITYPALGGGVHALDADLQLTDCEISGHDGPDMGGGIYVAEYAGACSVRLDDCAVHDNAAKSRGAGVHAEGTLLAAFRTSVSDNGPTADATFLYGGGLDLGGAAAEIDSCRIERNVAQFGAGLSTNGLGDLIVGGTLMQGNEALYLGGGVYLSATPQAIVIGNTIAMNDAVSGGAGVYASSSTADLTRNLIAFNTGGASVANGVHVTATTATFSCNDVFGNDGAAYSGTTDPTGADGNISEDPVLCSADPAGEDDWTIEDDSPCAPAHSGACGVIGAFDVGCTATPVFLASFTATVADGGVLVVWQVAPGGDAAEFRLLASDGGGERVVEHRAGADGRYTAFDRETAVSGTGSVLYTLQYREDGGAWLELAGGTADLAPPRVTALTRTHPNPFNPRLTVSFAVSAPQRVRVAVYDLAGRKVAVLADGDYAAGRYDAVWDGRDEAGRGAAAGTYFVQLRGRNVQDVRKVMLVR